MASGISKDLDRYLSSRRKDEKRRAKLSKKQQAEKVPEDLKSDEVHVIKQRPGFWARWFGTGSVQEEEIIEEDLSPEEMARLEAMQESMKKIDKIEEEHPEATEELEEVRESLLERFFSFFRLFERQHKLEQEAEELEQEEEEMLQRDEDVKLVLRSVHKWLDRLSKKEKAAFKKSKDFEIYKEVLDKYGLLKKKKKKKE